MSIITCDIPILEYDPDPTSIIMPEHEGLDLRLPTRAAFPFLGDEVERYATEHGARLVATFGSATKDYPVYVVDVDGCEICLVQAPVGAPAATQIMDWMVAYGVRGIVSAGSCGALEELDENVFLVPDRALRDEGTSYHYLPAARFVEVSRAARHAIEGALSAHGLAWREVMTWTCDGFYRETEAMVRHRRSEGCSVVEMECAALAACAELRGVTWGELLFTADTLADARAYDERGWGHDSTELAMRLCVEAAFLL